MKFGRQDVSGEATVPDGNICLEIVIVEDETDIASVLAEFFQLEGYAATVFTRVVPALTYLRARRPALVLTDLLLPGMRGEALIQTVRDWYGNSVPIIAMSASVNLDRLTTLAVDASVAKPFDLDDLLARVDQLVCGRAGLIAATPVAAHPSNAHLAQDNY